MDIVTFALRIGMSYNSKGRRKRNVGDESNQPAIVVGRKGSILYPDSGEINVMIEVTN